MFLIDSVITISLRRDDSGNAGLDEHFGALVAGEMSNIACRTRDRSTLEGIQYRVDLGVQGADTVVVDEVAANLRTVRLARRTAVIASPQNTIVLNNDSSYM